MNILVTGGSGLVGSALQEIIDKETTSKFTFLSSKDVDLTDATQTLTCFEKYKPDVVVHMASIVYGASSGDDAQYKSLVDNCRINVNVFDACSKYNVRKIITSLTVALSTEDPVNCQSIINGPDLNLQFHQGYVHSKRLLHSLSVSFAKSNKGDVILLYLSIFLESKTC